jgi:hypothetical protein
LGDILGGWFIVIVDVKALSQNESDVFRIVRCCEDGFVYRLRHIFGSTGVAISSGCHIVEDGVLIALGSDFKKLEENSCPG